jgi:hypothetical protein
MMPLMKYLEGRETYAIQREVCSALVRAPFFETRVQAVISKVRQTSKSHVVHCGRDVFPEGVEKVDASQVPGLRDLNWNPAMDELSVPSSH